MREHLAYSDFFLRGYPAGAEHDRDHTQTQRLMELARRKSLVAYERGKETDTDDALGDELWVCVEEAAREIGCDVPERPEVQAH